MDVQNDKQYSEFVKKGRNWHLNIIIQLEHGIASIHYVRYSCN